MGRYSYTQPSSGSRTSQASLSSTCRRSTGSCYGFPKRCFCGLSPVIQTSSTDLNPGRRFFGCLNYDDGGYHIYKWWDEAIMEEFQELKKAVEELAQSVDYLKIVDKPIWQSLQCNILKAEEDLSQLKELIQQIQKRFGDLEVKTMILVGLIILGMILFMFASYVI